VDTQAIAARLTAIAERLDDATSETHPQLKVNRYDHGGGRMFIDGETRQLIADFYDEAEREFYVNAKADLRFLSAHVETLTQQVAELEAHVTQLNAWIRHAVEVAAVFQDGGELSGVLPLGSSTVTDGMKWLLKERKWPHCPECNAPMVEVCAEQPLVCLLCQSRQENARLTAALTEARNMLMAAGLAPTANAALEAEQEIALLTEELAKFKAYRLQDIEDQQNLQAEGDAAVAALVKVRALTSYTPAATFKVVAGLLASIERICDAALSGGDPQ